MSGIVAVVAALLLYRLTMLVTADTITAPVRDRIVARYVHPTHELTTRPHRDRPVEHGGDWRFSTVCRCGARFVGDEWVDVVSEANGHVNERRGEMTTGPRWVQLLDCPWCASVWLSFPVAWSAWCFGTRAWWFVPSAALAGSAVTGIISTFAKPRS